MEDSLRVGVGCYRPKSNGQIFKLQPWGYTSSPEGADEFSPSWPVSVYSDDLPGTALARSNVAFAKMLSSGTTLSTTGEKIYGSRTVKLAREICRKLGGSSSPFRRIGLHDARAACKCYKSGSWCEVRNNTCTLCSLHHSMPPTLSDLHANLQDPSTHARTPPSPFYCSCLSAPPTPITGSFQAVNVSIEGPGEQTDFQHPEELVWDTPSFDFMGGSVTQKVWSQ